MIKSVSAHQVPVGLNGRRWGKVFCSAAVHNPVEVCTGLCTRRTTIKPRELRTRVADSLCVGAGLMRITR